ncbi:recombination protein NinG [Akkermansiaceae bacterium]|nr:recombination protein NinG [Akkermansiaceae bacterium]
MPRPRIVTRKKLIARLDKVFSQYVRSKNADHRGMVECFTCGQWKHWKTVDAGHFQSRAKFSTRWDLNNVKPQCKSCNGFRSGEQWKFARHLDSLYGEGTAIEIEQLSNTTKKWSSEELEAMIDVYNRRLRKL